jgi:hypothetical protein
MLDALPKRAIERSETDEPRLALCTTLKLYTEPKRFIPKVEKPLPNLSMLRKDMLDPMVPYVRTETERPSLA